MEEVLDLIKSFRQNLHDVYSAKEVLMFVDELENRLKDVSEGDISQENYERIRHTLVERIQGKLDSFDFDDYVDLELNSDRTLEVTIGGRITEDLIELVEDQFPGMVSDFKDLG